MKTETEQKLKQNFHGMSHNTKIRTKHIDIFIISNSGRYEKQIFELRNFISMKMREKNKGWTIRTDTRVTSSPTLPQ